MAFFKTSRKAEDVKDSSGSGFINKSGIYDIVINAIWVQENDKGARTLNMFFNHDGKDQVLYNAIRMEDNDGKPSYQLELLNKLNVILDIDETSEPEVMSLPIGAGGEHKEVPVLPDYCDAEVTVRIQIEYSKYEGKIQERKVIKNFFRTGDNATAAEILNDVEVGKQFAFEEPKASLDKYKDVEESEVQAWIEAGRPKEETTTKKPSGGFGSKPSTTTKRFGNR